MSEFSDRLRAEIEFRGLLQKEVADKAHIKKRALDMYLGTQGSIPPADIAVRIAQVLNVSVEYLVTGKEPTIPQEFLTYKDIILELSKLSAEAWQELKPLLLAQISAKQKQEQEKNKGNIAVG